MYQFDVTPDGFIRESAVNAMVAKLKDSFPETDSLALEAHLMLGMTHSYLADVKTDFRARFGITGRRFTVLRLLYLAEGRRLNMGTIAANLEIGTNNTTQLVDGLVRDGLVERMTAPDDKRVIYAVLSKAGAETVRSRLPAERGATQGNLGSTQRQGEAAPDPSVVAYSTELACRTGRGRIPGRATSRRKF